MVPNHLMDKLSQALLDLDNKVKLPDNNEVSRIRHSIEHALKTILDAVQKNDSRLTGKLLPVGSYYSDLKINIPDEFDYLYELHIFEEENFIVQPSGFRGSRNLWKTPNGDAGKRKVQVINPPASLLINNKFDDDNEQWLHSIGHEEHVLHPVHVKNSFYFGICEVLKEIDKSSFPKYLSLDPEEEVTFLYGPATTLFFRWDGRFFRNLKISVDITVCIKASKWENIIDCLQPGKINNQSCLKNKIHKEICQHGYHLVPFISDRGHIQWRISTSYLETQIFSKFSKDSSFKRIIRIVKSKKDQYLKYSPPKDCLLNQKLACVLKFYNFYEGKDYDENFRNLVSSFLIKNVVVQLCGFVSRAQWNHASLSSLYILTLSSLYRAIAERNCWNFYISEQKLSVPEYGDILPGFYRIFKEMDLKGYFSNNFALPVNELPQDWDGPFVDLFETKTVYAVYHNISDHLERAYHFVWNENENIADMSL